MKDNKGGIFSAWFSMFMSNVLIQSFHAIFLMFLMKFISQIHEYNNSKTAISKLFKSDDFLIALLTIGGIMGIIKFDNIVKKIFQIKDNSDIGSLGHNFYKSMQGLKAGTELVSRTAAPFKEHADIKKKRLMLDKRIDNKRKSDAAAENAKELGTSPTEQQARPLQGNGSVAAAILAGNGQGNAYGTEQYLNNNKVASSQIVDQNGRPISSGLNGTISGQNGVTNGTGTQGGGISDKNVDAITEAVDKLTKEMKKQSGDDDFDSKSLDDLIKSRDDLLLKERKSGMQRFTRLGSTIATVGGALGSTEGGIAEAIAAANAIDKPIDAMSDRYANRKVYKPVYEKAEKAYQEAYDSGDIKKINSAFKDFERASKNMNTSMATEIADFAVSAINNIPIKSPNDRLVKKAIKRKVDSIDSI